MATTEITIADLTASTLAGTGVFDVLMRASKVHLDDQFMSDRIRGPEYSEVYLGQMQSSMRTALEFIALQKRLPLEARLLELQVELAGIELIKAGVAVELAREQVLTAKIERQLVETQVDKLKLEMQLVPLQKLQIESETKLIEANLVNAGAEKLQIQANTAKITAETVNIPKQGLLLDAQLVTAQQQGINAEVENRVLEAQVCKLQAEFDLTKQSVLKAGAETTLLVQKLATEKAQILGLGVDDDSVIGTQKKLYVAQTLGFKRDAEQKAAGLYMEYWKTARMTDDAWQANVVNGLDDATMGRVMAKLRAGVDAP
jgi:hypothetical protein